MYNIATVYNHPSYNPYDFDYDFALLRVEKPIRLNSFTVKTIQLATPNDVIADSTLVFVSGWGLTQNVEESNTILRGVEVPTINQELCGTIYQDDGGISPRMICAGSAGKDSCSVRLLNSRLRILFHSLLL